MQLVRKNKTIQQDKMRSLETCFLANMLQDYFHNLKKNQVRKWRIGILLLLKDYMCVKIIFRIVILFRLSPLYLRTLSDPRPPFYLNDSLRDALQIKKLFISGTCPNPPPPPPMQIWNVFDWNSRFLKCPPPPWFFWNFRCFYNSGYLP